MNTETLQRDCLGEPFAQRRGRSGVRVRELVGERLQALDRGLVVGELITSATGIAAASNPLTDRAARQIASVVRITPAIVPCAVSSPRGLRQAGFDGDFQTRISVLRRGSTRYGPTEEVPR